jgi:uncharacterized protein (TIGR03437 family)
LKHAARRLIVATALTSTISSSLSAQPGIGQNGVVNSASQIPPTLPGGAIARGALFTVSGVRLSSPTGKTTATIEKQGEKPGAAVPVTIVSLQPRKMEAVMPATVLPGSYSLVISADGKQSKPFPVEVAAFNPGIFSRNLDGWGPGRIENLDAQGKRSDNSAANPARPGQQVLLAATGMGATKVATVVIGTRPVIAKASTGGARSGEERLTFAVPADVPLGCWVPVYVQITPQRASNVVTMSIQKGSGLCNPGPLSLISAKAGVVAVLSRSRVKPARANLADALTDDTRILVKSAGRAPLLTRTDFPPAGTCITSSGSYQNDTELAISISSLIVPDTLGLDAGGEMVLQRAAGNGRQSESREIPKIRENGMYRARLGAGGSAIARGVPERFLEPGNYRLEVRGGADTGPFAPEFSFPNEFQWLDRDQIATVDRSRGVTVHWSGIPPAGDGREQLVAAVVRNVDLITTAIGTCLCTAKASAGQITIPASMLANIPVSIQHRGERYDKLVLGSLSAKVIPGLKIKGVDEAVIFTVHDNGRIVDFK